MEMERSNLGGLFLLVFTIDRRQLTLFLAIPAVLFLSSCNTPDPAAQYRNLKIINWNILYSFNHKLATDAGIEWLKQQQADVLGLQELKGTRELRLSEMAQKWGHEYSAILKERGFPVGLTSRKPIEVIERKVDRFHHGYLHCRTFGIDFFVVHFWRGKDHEAEYILEKIDTLIANGRSVIVMGDFNNLSRKDSAFLAGRHRGDPSFNVVDMFESKGFVDLVHKHDKQALVSFGSPILIPKYVKTTEELVNRKQRRIDFIFADGALAKVSTSATILRSDELDAISDHYPVTAEFRQPLQ